MEFQFWRIFLRLWVMQAKISTLPKIISSFSIYCVSCNLIKSKFYFLCMCICVCFWHYKIQIKFMSLSLYLSSIKTNFSNSFYYNSLLTKWKYFATPHKTWCVLFTAELFGIYYVELIQKLQYLTVFSCEDN